MSSISLGLEHFAPKPSTSTLNIDATIALGYECLQSLAALEAGQLKVEAMQSTARDLAALGATIKKHGVDKSLVKLFGRDLCKVSRTLNSKCEDAPVTAPAPGDTSTDTALVPPAALEEGPEKQLPPAAPAIAPDSTTTTEIVTEVSAATEGAWETIKQTVKNLIARLIEWIKSFFTNAEKMAKDLDEAVKNAKRTDVDLKEVTVLGYDVMEFKGRAGAAMKAAAVINLAVSMYNEGKDYDLIGQEIVKTLGESWTFDGKVLAPKSVERNVKSIDAHGFSVETIKKTAGDVSAALQGLKDQDAALKKAETALSKESSDKKASATQILGLISKMITVANKEALQLGAQSLKMLKPLQGDNAAKKDEPKK